MEAELMHKKMLLVPKIRFREFGGELLPTIFGKVVESNLYGPRFNANDYCESGNVKTIRGTDLGKDGEIKYQQVPLARLDENTVASHKLMDGDIIMITTAECGSTGVFRKQEIDYLSSAYGVRIRLNELGYSYYFKYFFQTRLAKKEINSFIRKATVANLPGSDILKIKLYLPILCEQKKIASFLSAVDQKIQQLTRKKELLEQYKKGLMQQVFTGALRFKDENGDAFPKWYEKNLGDVVNIMQSGISRKLSDLDIGLPVIRSNNLQNGRLDSADIKYWLSIDDQGANLDNYILNEGDLLINFINSLAQIGKLALFKDLLKRKTIFTTNILRLTFNKLVSSNYIFYYFHLKKYSDFIDSITKPAVNQASFTTKDFKKFKIQIPCLYEQKKIEAYLSNIDDKIASVNKQMTQTQIFKNGLLQQMFAAT